MRGLKRGWTSIVLQTARCCRCVIFTLYVAIVFPNLETSQLQTIVRDLDLITTLKQQLPVLITKCAHCDICNTDMCVGCLYYPILHENRSSQRNRGNRSRSFPCCSIFATLCAYRHTWCIHQTNALYGGTQCCRLCANINNTHSAFHHKKVHISTYGT